MEFSEYEKVIIKDVGSSHYAKSGKYVKLTFSLVFLLLLAIYLIAFHSTILDNLKFIIKTYRESIYTADYDLKLLVYNFNRLLAFFIFLFFYFFST